MIKNNVDAAVPQIATLYGLKLVDYSPFRRSRTSATLEALSPQRSASLSSSNSESGDKAKLKSPLSSTNVFSPFKFSVKPS